ncbi:hypothetical protein V8E36_005581 [Tilletia maclaganii]
MAKSRPQSSSAGPVMNLLVPESQQDPAQAKWLRDTLQVVASPIASIKQRLVALAKLEQHMASTVLSGDAAKEAIWWSLQQTHGCNITAVLLPHLHSLLLHLRMVAYTSQNRLYPNAHQTGLDKLRLSTCSTRDLDLIAEEIVASLSLLQGLVVCDKGSRVACTGRAALECMLLILSAPHLAEKDLVGPACHALDLLMCVLVDADEDVSDLFENLGGIDQISAIWKVRAETVAMRKAAARVEREAARLRGGMEPGELRRSRPGTPRAASDGLGLSSPSKLARRAYSEDDRAARPTTPYQDRTEVSPDSPFQPMTPKRLSSSRAETTSPSGPRILQRSSSAVDSGSSDVTLSPTKLYSNEEAGASRRALGAIGPASPDETDITLRGDHSPIKPKQREQAAHKRTTSRTGEATTRDEGNDNKDEDDEGDELCEKCIEFLIFYLQPELLEKEAERERRLRDKMAKGTLLQLGVPKQRAVAERTRQPGSGINKEAKRVAGKQSARPATAPNPDRSPTKKRIQ